MIASIDNTDVRSVNSAGYIGSFSLEEFFRSVRRIFSLNLKLLNLSNLTGNAKSLVKLILNPGHFLTEGLVVEMCLNQS